MIYLALALQKENIILFKGICVNACVINATSISLHISELFRSKLKHKSASMYLLLRKNSLKMYTLILVKCEV